MHEEYTQKMRAPVIGRRRTLEAVFSLFHQL
jgi:hypothetical protein